MKYPLAIAIVLAGCASTPDAEPADIPPLPLNRSADIRADTTGATNAVQDIDEQAESGQVDHPELAPRWSAIRASAAVAVTHLVSIASHADKLDVDQEQIEALRTDLAEARKQAEKLRDESIRASTNKWLVMAGFGGVALAAGVALAIFGMGRMGLAIGGGGGVLAAFGTFMATSVHAISKLATIIGYSLGVGVGLLVLVGVAWLSWRLFRYDACVGPEAQAKLMSKGNKAGAAAAAFADAGGGEKGRAKAKAIEKES